MSNEPVTPASQSGPDGNAGGSVPSQVRSSEAELQRLEEELAQLGREAMEQGGLREPGDYAEFLARREYLEERIHTIRQLDSFGRPRAEDAGGHVGAGQRVTIKTEDGSEETWRIVAPAVARPREGSISDRSPLGRALIGRRAGEVVDVPSPEGSYQVTVLQVEGPS